jgi:hypothetical protein
MVYLKVLTQTYIDKLYKEFEEVTGNRKLVKYSSAQSM